MKRSLKMNAVLLRLILSVSIMLIFAASIITFVYGGEYLRTYGTEVKTVVTEAKQSESTLSQLRITERLLEEQKEAVKKASDVVTESKRYVYQDRIVDDLQGYASQTGVTIQSIAFQEKKPGTAGGSSTPAAAPTSSGAPAAQPAAPAGLKTMPVSITFRNPVNYTSMLNFIRALELNSAKMQIVSIGLTRSEDAKSGPGDITTNAIVVEVYVK